MDIFTIVHKLDEWDLTSHSGGEYFEVSSSDSDSDNFCDNFDRLHVNSDSDSGETFVFECKMFQHNPVRSQINDVMQQLATL